MFTRFFEGLTGITPNNNDPNQVIEVNDEDYATSSVVCRQECLMLYKTKRNSSTLPKFEIVLLNNVHTNLHRAFSLFRTDDETNSRVMFIQLQDKLPLLIECVPDIATSKFTLQNITQLLREKPSWTAAHIAAHYGYLECFKNKLIQSQVNRRCEDTLMTPLHVAVKGQQIGSVVILVELDARLDITDTNGDTVFHYAATTTKDIIQVLCGKPFSSIINKLNNKGCTPFHLACMADKTDCVMEFLKAGVDVNLSCDLHYFDDNSLTCTDSPSRGMKVFLDTYSNRFFNNDIKYGGTPLHWSKTPEHNEYSQYAI